MVIAKNIKYGTIYPISQVEYYGNIAYMICSSGTTMPKWTKQGKPLFRRHSITDNTLAIPNIKHTDSGVYICHGSNFTARSVLLVGCKYYISLRYKCLVIP